MIRTLAASLLLAGLLLAPAAVPAQSSKRPLAQDTFVEISRRVLPSVVNITIGPKGGEMTDEEKEAQIRQFFIERQQGEMPFFGEATGSGVLIARQGDTGYIITNNHVVRPLNDNSQITLTFHLRGEDSTEYNQTTEVAGESVRVIGRDELSDLAVIEFLIPEPLKDLEPVPFADSDKTEIGEFVLALGNPLNFNHTITQGIISGKSRFLGSSISLEDLIQTDAVIQPGNSGGPLVNLDGQIVGINNAIISRTGLWQGVSFAIPGNDAKRISDQLMANGRVTRGYLGVTMVDASRNRGRLGQYELPANTGVLISHVVPNSPADLAGIHISDIVVEVDGKPVENSDMMLKAITEKGIDEEVALGVVRLDEAKKAQRMVLTAKLGERPNEQVLQEIHRNNQGEVMIPFVPEQESIERTRLGIEVTEVPDDGSGKAGLEVTDISFGSRGARAGLREGDVLTFVNRRAVRTPEDLRAALATTDDRIVLEGFRADGTNFTFEMTSGPEEPAEPGTDDSNPAEPIQ